MNGNREVDQQFNVINSTKETVHKMHLIATMSEKARIRTRLTGKLLAIDDFFIKDEITLELDKAAGQFAAAREGFLKLPLSSFEQDMIKQQNKIIAVVLKNQLLTVDMAMSENPELLIEAQKILYDIVFPGQGKLIDLFMIMLKKYETDINTQTQLAHQNYIENNEFRYYLLITFIVLAVFVMVFISRKIYLIEKKLHIEKQRTHTTLMSIGDAVITTDAEGNILDCNQVAENLLQVSSSGLLGKKFSSVVSLSKEGVSVQPEDIFNQSLTRNHKVLTENLKLKLSENNDFIHIELLLSPIIEHGHKAGCVITFRDVSEKKELEQKLNQQAKFDALTGLLNRYSFEALCKGILKKQDKRTICCLCVLDLDRFKNINDSCGHGAGDIVLKQLAEIMKLSIREPDYLSRIGGDEFTIILENCDKNNASRIMQNIIKNISEYTFSHNDINYTLGCSIGITEIKAEDTSCSEVFKRADSSCYQAKNTGRNRVVVYSDLVENKVQTTA
ncbi:MAG: diguanylate cyclase [Pseudomonadota bacterium]